MVCCAKVVLVVSLSIAFVAPIQGYHFLDPSSSALYTPHNSSISAGVALIAGCQSPMNINHFCSLFGFDRI